MWTNLLLPVPVLVVDWEPEGKVSTGRINVVLPRLWSQGLLASGHRKAAVAFAKSSLSSWRDTPYVPSKYMSLMTSKHHFKRHSFLFSFYGQLPHATVFVHDMFWRTVCSVETWIRSWQSERSTNSRTQMTTKAGRRCSNHCNLRLSWV